MLVQISPCIHKQICCVFIWLIQNSKIYSSVFLCRGQIKLIAIYSLQSIDINTITVLWFKITILFTAKICIYLKITAIICKQYVISVLKIRCLFLLIDEFDTQIWHSHYVIKHIFKFNLYIIHSLRNIFIGVVSYHNQNIIFMFTLNLITD